MPTGSLSSRGLLGFGLRLLLVASRTDGLQIVLGVIVSSDDVIYLGCLFKAPEGLELAQPAISPEDS